VEDVVQHQLLQDDLSKLVNWSKKWQMRFNTTKCKILYVGKTNQRFQYMMDNQILGGVTEERDLGILVSSDLEVSANCVAAYKKNSGYDKSDNNIQVTGYTCSLV